MNGTPVNFGSHGRLATGVEPQALPGDALSNRHTLQNCHCRPLNNLEIHPEKVGFEVCRRALVRSSLCTTMEVSAQHEVAGTAEHLAHDGAQSLQLTRTFMGRQGNARRRKGR